MKRSPIGPIVAVLLCACLSGTVAAAPSTLVTATSRDGHRDFDFLFGTWHTHYRILRKRLARSHDWYDCYGTSVVRPFWTGSANLEDGDLRCPNRYIGGMTLRLYGADTHQWSLWWGTRKLGLVPPPQVGHFNGGVGNFYARDTYNGTPVIVRFRWNEPAPGRPRFEQAFSADGGRSWETNWTTDYTRAATTAKNKFLRKL